MENPKICAVIEQDLRLIRRLRELVSDCGFNMHLTRSCNEAMLHFRGIGIYANRKRFPLPTLTILDTGNEQGSNLEFLAWLRQEPQFKTMPVVLLAYEPPHKARVACALDPLSFVVDRETLWEIPSIAWGLLFGVPLVLPGPTAEPCVRGSALDDEPARAHS